MSASITYTPNIPPETPLGIAQELRKIAEVFRRLRDAQVALEARVTALEPP